MAGWPSAAKALAGKYNTRLPRTLATRSRAPNPMATKAARADSSAPAVAAPPVAALDAPSAAAPELKLSYEEALAELEQLVSRMEAGSLPLDQLLTAYQRGATLLSFCRGRLEAVEAQVKVLEDGQLQPWNDA